MHWKRRLYIFVDLGSIHSFLSEQIGHKLGCYLKPVERIKVIVVNGLDLQCKFICEKLGWRLQGQTIFANAYTLYLDNYDLMLGDILWNLKNWECYLLE